MVKVGFLSGLLSNFFPVKIIDSSSSENPVLQLYLYKGQWQLATQDALYSDGTRYRPMLWAFKKIENKLPDVKKAMVLGAGLGSAAQILNKMDFHPEIRLVDIDEKVLEWAKELMPSNEKINVQYIHADAFQYIKNTTQKYDLIILDLFKGRVMPDFLNNENFLNDCKTKIASKGVFILNYMISSNKNWEEFQRIFIEIFPDFQVIKIGINRVLIATIA